MIVIVFVCVCVCLNITKAVTKITGNGKPQTKPTKPNCAITCFSYGMKAIFISVHAFMYLTTFARLNN